MAWDLLVAWGLLPWPQVFISFPLPHDREAFSLFLLGGADEHVSLPELSVQEALHVALRKLPEHDCPIASDQGRYIVLRSVGFFEGTFFSPDFCLLVRQDPTRQEVSQRAESGDGPDKNHLVEQSHTYCSTCRGGRADAVAALAAAVPRQAIPRQQARA